MERCKFFYDIGWLILDALQKNLISFDGCGLFYRSVLQMRRKNKPTAKNMQPEEEI